jgi:hypothetical protein
MRVLSAPALASSTSMLWDPYRASTTVRERALKGRRDGGPAGLGGCAEVGDGYRAIRGERKPRVVSDLPRVAVGIGVEAGITSVEGLPGRPPRALRFRHQVVDLSL